MFNVYRSANRILGLEVYNVETKKRYPLNQFLVDKGVLHKTGSLFSSYHCGSGEIEVLPG